MTAPVKIRLLHVLRQTNRIVAIITHLCGRLYHAIVFIYTMRSLLQPGVGLNIRKLPDKIAFFKHNGPCGMRY